MGIPLQRERLPRGRLIKRPNHLKLSPFDAKELPLQWIATLPAPSWEVCCQWSQRRGETKSHSIDSDGQVIKVLGYLTLNRESRTPFLSQVWEGSSPGLGPQSLVWQSLKRLHGADSCQCRRVTGINMFLYCTVNQVHSII